MLLKFNGPVPSVLYADTPETDCSQLTSGLASDCALDIELLNSDHLHLHSIASPAEWSSGGQPGEELP
jgi:hypothetical protein